MLQKFLCQQKVNRDRSWHRSKSTNSNGMVAVGAQKTVDIHVFASQPVVNFFPHFVIDYRWA